MAPSLLDPPSAEAISAAKLAPTLSSNSNTAISSARAIKVCSDPSILPSDKASKRTRDLWWLHGHPHSTRYSDPKLVSLAALVRYAGQEYKGQTAFLYPVRADATTPYQSMTWDEFDAATEKIALRYAYQLRMELKKANATHRQPTIAILGAGRTLEYFCTELALQKLGVRVLLLAESNSLSGFHHLLESCEALVVITDLKNAGINTNGIRKLQMIDDIPKGTETHHTDIAGVKFQDFGDVWERHTFIIHSSGSTGMPKPIIHTNRSMMLIARMYRLFQEFAIENWFLLFPLYHIAGISIALSGLPNGLILSFPPLLWPTPSSHLIKAWETLSLMGHPIDCVHCAPMLIENMYEHILDNGRDFGPLSSLKLLQPGGAVLAENIIKDLIEHGVNVKSTYGSTEIGPPFRSLPTRSNKDCYAFRNLYPDNPFLKMEQVGDGLYECVVYKGFELAADLWAGKHDDEPFRTNDLFRQEPPQSGFFVLQGRKDDILVHTNGENTSAGPLQLDIRTASKVIKNTLAVGHSLPYVGLLVEVYDEHDPEHPRTEELIWTAIDEVNSRYPSHSQVMRNMIYILPRGSTLPVTPKGNVKRRTTTQLYANEIAQLYSYDVSPLNLPSPSPEPLAEFLRNLFARVSGVPVSSIYNWTTIFDLGVESRLALSIRCSLSKRLGKPISLNTIFERPSISQLLLTLEAESPTNTDSIVISSTQAINKMISKLEAEFKSWAPRTATTTYPSTDGDTILLTGSTGSLGTALLESLSCSPQVTKIYAMVRGPNHAVRLKDALGRKGIDPLILNGSKIEVLNFSMQDPFLGLDIDTYHTLATSVTMVVHNAWKMDFNVGVEEFEGDCIRSTMSLLRFCYAGRPKTLAFTSSITTYMGPGQKSSSVPESAVSNDPSVSLSTGYAQSKYIIERVTQTASSQSGLHIPIHLLRIGQLCGSLRTGLWNTAEMYPILFATSFHPRMHCIPSFESKCVDWLPIDIAATVISELLFPQDESAKSATAIQEKEKNDTYTVHNIVNPNPIPWSSLISMLRSSAGTHVEEVPMTEWVRRLTALADEGLAASEIPGLRLLGFFERMASEEEGSKDFETGRSREHSRALRECGAVCREWIDANVKVWKGDGFLIV